MHQEVLPTDDWDGMVYENIWKITKKNTLVIIWNFTQLL